MSKVSHANYPALDAFKLGWTAEKNWDARSVVISEKFSDLAKKGWGAAWNGLEAVANYFGGSSKNEIHYKRVNIKLNISEALQNAPRRAVEESLNRGTAAVLEPQQRTELSFQLGRAAHRTWKHAALYPAHSIAWALIFTSALRMDSFTTLTSSALFTLAAGSYRLGEIYVASANQGIASNEQGRDEAAVHKFVADAKHWVYTKSQEMRTNAGKNEVPLLGIALTMAIASQVNSSGLLAMVVGGVTGFATAHYWAQEF